MTFFEDRAASVDVKLAELARRLKTHLDVDEKRVLQNDTCIYIVGLIQSFSQSEFAHARVQEGRDFADAMFALLQELGRVGRAKELFRHMVV